MGIHSRTAKKILVIALTFGLGTPLLAQNESLHFIENKLTAFRNKNLREKLFVHTDKPTYLAGEFLWFKVYYVEGYTHHPLALSQVAYLEILNATNQPVVQAKASLKAGEENGSFYLPLNLPTGNYKLRAYTAWMKNFGPETFFEKTISVINPLSNTKASGKAQADNGYELSFFPEGGNLVQGLQSVLAFKATDRYGKGLGFKGWILNEKNDTVAAFSPFKFGMGKMPFQPLAGHAYKAVALFADGQVVKRDLPQVFSNGYVMRLQKINPSQIQIEVKNNESPGAEQAFLIAHTREVISVAQQASFKNGVALFTIDPTHLTTGVTQFTIFDEQHRPLAERIYFTPPQASIQATARTDKKEYFRREKINLTVETADEKTGANLSLSVFRVDSIQGADKTNIENYLLLTSDLAGAVESPDYYFGEASAEKEEATDNLLLTQGWRRFRWQNMLRDKEPIATYPPEVNGAIINAKVYDIRNGQPAAGVQAFASLPGKHYQVYFAQSDSAGRLQFELKSHFGPGEVIIKPFPEGDSIYRIELQNAFSEQYTKEEAAPFSLRRQQAGLLENYSIGMQVRQVYAGDSLNRFRPQQLRDTFSFLGSPDYTYNLDDYTRFTTTEEVLREYVRPISVGVKNGKPHVLFINEASKSTYDNNVLVMLDGVPLNTPDSIFSYDPLKVKQLEIFPRPYVMGSNYFFGVASFSTYKGEFDAFNLDPHSIALDYQGLQMQREFYTPVYETEAQKASRLPDYRNTLYWNPTIKTTAGKPASLSFYSCDQRGHYLGVLQGMSGSGQPVVREFSFDVK